MINGGSGSYFQIFDKTGATVVNQTYFDNFFGMPGGAGDPIVLYDELAGRCLMSVFSSVEITCMSQFLAHQILLELGTHIYLTLLAFLIIQNIPFGITHILLQQMKTLQLFTL